MKVKDAMHKGVTCVEPTTPVKELAKRMRDSDIGAIPVCAEGRLVGIVTDRDITCRAVADTGNLGKRCGETTRLRQLPRAGRRRQGRHRTRRGPAGKRFLGYPEMADPQGSGACRGQPTGARYGGGPQGSRLTRLGSGTRHGRPLQGQAAAQYSRKRETNSSHAARAASQHSQGASGTSLIVRGRRR
jgi:hypothetical protein